MATVDVILKKKVEKLGGEGEVVSVKRGFARNFLLPQGIAYEATKGNLRQIAALEAVRTKREAEELELATKVANRVNKQRIKLTLNTGQGGKAFGSITVKDIQEAMLNCDAKIDLDRKDIALDAPIKSTGKFDVPVNLHPDVECRIRLQIDPEGGAAGAEANKG